MVSKRSSTAVIILVIGFVVYWTAIVNAESNHDDLVVQSVQEQLDALNLHQLTEFVSKIEPDYQEYIPKLEWQTIYSQGFSKLNLLGILTTMFQNVFKEVIFSSHLMRQLLLIGLLTALIRQLQLTVENKELVNAHS